MYKLKFLIAFFLTAACSAYSQTSVSGGIYQNTTWTLAGSPYIVTGSIVVFPGKTLTIEPGIEIRIDNQSSNGIYIEARGGISMIGAPTNPIKVRTMVDTANIGWIGFKSMTSLGGSISANYFQISNAVKPFDFEGSNNNITYSNCMFANNEQAIRVDSSVTLNNCSFRKNGVALYGWSNFSINNCSFIDNGIGINAYATNFQMVNSTFDANDTGVTFSSFVFNPMTIENCTFNMNGKGIDQANNGEIRNCSFTFNNIGIDYAYDCSIYDNAFNDNDTGLTVSFESVVTNNNISTNGTGISVINLSSASVQPIIMNNEICSNNFYNVDNQTNVNLSLQTNCFCGLDSSAIEQFLFDGYDDITKGLINYTLYDTTCTSILGTVSKFQDQSAGQFEAVTSSLSFSNPVTDYLEFFEETEFEALIIHSTSGQSFLVNAQSANVFDLRFLKPGIYIVHCISENNTTQLFKLMKQ